MSYLNLATHQVLLRSYEELAILHNRKNKPENGFVAQRFHNYMILKFLIIF